MQHRFSATPLSFLRPRVRFLGSRPQVPRSAPHMHPRGTIVRHSDRPGARVIYPLCIFSWQLSSPDAGESAGWDRNLQRIGCMAASSGGRSPARSVENLVSELVWRGGVTTFRGFRASSFQRHGSLSSRARSLLVPLCIAPLVPRTAPDSMLRRYPGNVDPGDHLPFVHRNFPACMSPRLAPFSILCANRRCTLCTSPVGHLGFWMSRVGQGGTLGVSLLRNSRGAPHPGLLHDN